MQKYQYKPLQKDEIRLIKLWTLNGLPVIQIEHVQLREAENGFEALSYVWGDVRKRLSLLCGMGLYLFVTKNLISALRSLSARPGHDEGPLRLWVDAICINQEDLEERGSQVMLMRDIYQKARQTVAYVDDMADDIGLAVNFINDLQHRFELALKDREGLARILKTDRNLQHRVDLALKDRGGPLAGIIKNDRKDFHTPSRLSPEAVLRVAVPQIYHDFGSTKRNLFKDARFSERPTMASLVALLCRPYFQRAWIVQELVVSKNVKMYCGTLEFSLPALFMFFAHTVHAANLQWNAVVRNTAGNAGSEFSRGVQQLMSVWDLRRDFNDDSEYQMRLYSLISKLRAARATQDEDKIYAFLGLATDKFLDEIKVDYKKTKQQIYTDVARILLRHGEGDYLINEAACSGFQDDDLPSWIPDWSQIPKLCGFGHVFSESDPLLSFFKASGKLSKDKRHQILQTRGNVLITKGVLLQTIVITGATTPAMQSNAISNANNFCQVASDLATFAERLAGKYPTGEDKFRAIAKIFEADQKRLPAGPTLLGTHESETILIEMDEDVIKDLSKRDKRLHYIHDVLLSDPISLRNAARATTGRKFAMTHKSYAGLVPAAARPGDMVSILSGFSVPFILRKRGGQYRLIGDCYMHGMMQGEMMVKENTDKMQKIEII